MFTAYSFRQRFIQFNEQISRVRYEIGFFEESSFIKLMSSSDKSQPFGKKEIHWLKHSYKDRWFADPFILDISENHIIILVEEYIYNLDKGRIAKLTIDRESYKLISNITILELPTHLSFPIIKRMGSDIYIYPENSQSNKLSLYKLSKDFSSCHFVKCIIDKPLTDAVIFNDIIFSTSTQSPNGKILDTYKYHSETNKYVKEQSILFNERIARNAGDFIIHNNRTYRPAQECNHSYGHCVVIQEVINKEKDKFLFIEIRRIYSSHPLLKDGLHTLNHHNGLFVIDVNGPRHPLIRKIIIHLYSFYKFLLKLLFGKQK